MDGLETQLEWLVAVYGYARVLIAFANVAADHAEGQSRRNAELARGLLAVSVALESIKVPKRH